jgi:hypothetical protein
MKPIYEIIEIENSGSILKKTDSSGQVWLIPTDPANSDYQAYLNRDNPDWNKPHII